MAASAQKGWRSILHSATPGVVKDPREEQATKKIADGLRETFIRVLIPSLGIEQLCRVERRPDESHDAVTLTLELNPED